MKALRVEVPATSANLGPGFDTLGMALEVVDRIQVKLHPDSNDVILAGAETLDPNDNLLCRAYRSWSVGTGVELPGATFHVERQIPLARGLGSSAAAIVAGLAAARAVTPMAREEGVATPGPALDRLLQLATSLEGHPDNVAAALLGGVTVAFGDGAEVRALRIANHVDLGVAVFLPRDPLPTTDARRALPVSVPFTDAVFDLGRLAYLTAALVWGRWELIGPAMDDRLHQPYRARLIPGLTEVIAAARETGAYGAALSGSGPSVIALVPRERVEAVARAMEDAAYSRSWPGHGLVTGVRDTGVLIHEET